MDTDRPMIGSTNVRLEVENIIDLVELEDSPVTLLHVKTVVSLHPSHREFSDHAAERWHSCIDFDQCDSLDVSDLGIGQKVEVLAVLQVLHLRSDH